MVKETKGIYLKSEVVVICGQCPTIRGNSRNAKKIIKCPLYEFVNNVREKSHISAERVRAREANLRPNNIEEDFSGREFEVHCPNSNVKESVAFVYEIRRT